MNIQVDPTSSNLASAMLNSKIRPRAVVGYGVQIFHPSPPNYVTRSPGLKAALKWILSLATVSLCGLTCEQALHLRIARYHAQVTFACRSRLKIEKMQSGRGWLEFAGTFYQTFESWSLSYVTRAARFIYCMISNGQKSWSNADCWTFNTPKAIRNKTWKKHFIFLMSVISGEAWRERKHLRINKIQLSFYDKCLTVDQNTISTTDRSGVRKIFPPKVTQLKPSKPNEVTPHTTTSDLLLISMLWNSPAFPQIQSNPKSKVQSVDFKEVFTQTTTGEKLY